MFFIKIKNNLHKAYYSEVGSFYNKNKNKKPKICGVDMGFK